ncbi:MAG TPA: NADH-quinone oxidoreductase subunit J [Candidatus Polarisedimenticolaceae bacterium]|nr:NADH-quinone oxidoreductase subunit J [Candidatus Polarisedimenticolaceae bacterium]
MAVFAFYVLALLTVASALVVVTHRNPVVAAVALAFNLVSIAGFYILLGAQFIGLVQVIVYAGAIMVLILFVIMLLNLAEEVGPHPAGTFQRVLAPAATVVFALVLGRALWRGAPSTFPPASEGFGTAAVLGRELFTRYYYPFEVISLLLIVAMVGAVLLAKRKLT